VAFGRSLAGIFIAVATAKLVFITATLALLSGSGGFLIGWVIMRPLQ